MAGNLAHVITRAKSQDEIFRDYNFTGVEFPISILIFAWALHHCSVLSWRFAIFDRASLWCSKFFFTVFGYFRHSPLLPYFALLLYWALLLTGYVCYDLRYNFWTDILFSLFLAIALLLEICLKTRQKWAWMRNFKPKRPNMKIAISPAAILKLHYQYLFQQIKVGRKSTTCAASAIAIVRFNVCPHSTDLCRRVFDILSFATAILRPKQHKDVFPCKHGPFSG